MNSPNNAEGVVFPMVGDRRSTTVTGKHIVAEALATVDPIGSHTAARETSWRQGYVPHFRRLVEAGLVSAVAAQDIARAGLIAVHDQFVFTTPHGEESLRVAMQQPRHELITESVAGDGAPVTELVLPYRGQKLSGAALLAQLDTWVGAGVIEPELAEIISRVAANPQWLSLPDHHAVVMGAAAEMGPLMTLLRWGATISAIDLPSAGLWTRVLTQAKKLAGTLHVPAHAGAASLAARAGADIVSDVAALGQWLAARPENLILGNYVYADGATNVRVSVAVDAISSYLMECRDDIGLAFLATPTDIFAVSEDVVAAATARYENPGRFKLARLPLKAISGGRLLRRNYVPGVVPGINDSVVVQQGPNYLLAKRIQRWRATHSRAEGHTVSFSVAPPTRTRSVVKNRALASAYAGAHAFGIEVFEPATASTLMAAKLVHDVHLGSPRQPHPWQDEAFGAAHGGLWRTGYDARSSLGLAAVLGLASR